MKIFALKLLLLMWMTIFISCSQERPSTDPPIHLNPNMDDQPKYEAMEESQFFLDKSAMRMPVIGTVASGKLNEDSRYYLGKNTNDTFVKKMPSNYRNYLSERIFQFLERRAIGHGLPR